jgi:hypothetical protein
MEYVAGITFLWKMFLGGKLRRTNMERNLDKWKW